MTSKKESTDEVSDEVPDGVNPDLIPLLKVLQSAPIKTIDSWSKVTEMNFFSNMAGPSVKGVKEKKVKGKGLYLFPQEEVSHELSGSAVLYAHSGGRVMGTYDNGGTVKAASTIVDRLKVPVLSAKYSVGSHQLGRYPHPLDELVDAYKWLQQKLQSQAKEGAKIRIIVAGASAGGGLAAELCQRLLHESSTENADDIILPVAQILIYPMLDDRTCTIEQQTEHVVWNNTANMFGWSMYLRDSGKPGDETLPDFAAASRREDLSNLPPAWIMVGTLDLFFDECKQYEQRLRKHGVQTHFHEVRGGFHAIMEAPIGINIFNTSIWTSKVGQVEPPILEAWASLQKFGAKYLSI